MQYYRFHCFKQPARLSGLKDSCQITRDQTQHMIKEDKGVDMSQPQHSAMLTPEVLPLSTGNSLKIGL